MIHFPCILLPPANEVWGKIIFSQACVKNSVHRGVPGPGGWVCVCEDDSYGTVLYL